MRRAVPLLWCLATALAAPAAEARDTELSVVKELVREGLTQAKKGRCDEAVPVFEQAIAIRPTGDAYMGLGDCVAKKGELLRALDAYERAEDTARKDKDQATLRAVVAKLSNLRELVPRLSVVLPAGVTEPKVSVDGKPVPPGALDRLVPVDPGEHAVEVVAAGRGSFSTRVRVGEREVATVNVVFPEAPRPASGGPTGLPVGTLVAGGAAVTLLLGGVVSFVAAGNVASDGEEACGARRTCSDTTADTVHSLDAAALGLWIAGGVSAGVAVGFWALEDGEASASATVGLAPGGVFLRGTY